MPLAQGPLGHQLPVKKSLGAVSLQKWASLLLCSTCNCRGPQDCLRKVSEEKEGGKKGLVIWPWVSGPTKGSHGFLSDQGSGSSLVLQLPRCGPGREEMSGDEVRTMEDRGWGRLPLPLPVRMHLPTGSCPGLSIWLEPWSNSCVGIINLSLGDEAPRLSMDPANGKSVSAHSARPGLRASR